MQCSNCGNQMAPGTTFCGQCGAPAGQPGPAGPAGPIPNQARCPRCGQAYTGQPPICGNCGLQFASPSMQQVYTAPKSKVAAGVLGILLGGLGIHNFYLGFTTKALIQLLVSIIGGLLTFGLASAGMYIWGLVEGIMILTGNPNYSRDARGVPLSD